MVVRGRNRGFTLIELLVVIAIIALLIAILLPALSSAKGKANTAKCAVNTRSLNNAVQMYIADWKKMFPFADSQPQSWTQLLFNGGAAEGAGGTISQNTGGGYGALEKIRFCPEATDYGTAQASGFSAVFGNAHKAWANSPFTGGTAALPFGSSYGLNGWVYSYSGSDMGMLNALDGNAPAELFYRLTGGTTNPSLTPVFADCNWRHMFARPDDGFPSDRTLEDPGPESLSSHPLCRVVLNRHNMQVNVGFFDNHSETIGLRNVGGVNWSPNWIAPPPLNLPPQ